MSVLLLLNREAVQQQIAKRVDDGRGLLNEPIQNPNDLSRLQKDRTRWHRFNVDLLKRLFSDESMADEYDEPVRRVFYSETFMQQIQSFHRDLESHINRLRSIIERTEIYEEAPSVTTSAPASIRLGDAVFIVHGHAGREYEVALAIKDLRLEPVILKEELHGGSPTLIEKLEREAERCGYAVVLFTPDDLGRAVNEADLAPRARQNVVLELGFFIAKLSRERVTILHDPTVSIPSDFGGVAYYPLDADGAWKGRLAGELRRVGLGAEPSGMTPNLIDGGTP